MSDYKEQVAEIISCLGGTDNISSVSNCMTRLRVSVRDEAAVNEAGLQSREVVLGLVHDRPFAYEIVIGPGKCKKYADCCIEMGLGGPGDAAEEREDGRQQEDEPEDTGQQKKRSRNRNKTTVSKELSGDSGLKNALKTIGDIFVPLLPGVIAAGLCTGFASLLKQAVPGYADIRVLSILYDVLSLISIAFMSYITAWAGYRAAERFGATPILGGMLGMITSLDGINSIAMQLGLYQADAPLESILRNGRGGVLAVIFGVLLLSRIEKWIRSKLPDSLDVIFTPLLSLLLCAIPYILILMPLLGLVSGGIEWVISELCLSRNIIVRGITGFISAALFLPLVASGMHHGLIALYTVQLESLGYITLYPALAMAGAGQVGAALAIRKKAKRAEDSRLCSVIDGALPAGILGVGEPLVYGVTLPLGKPFFTAGIGAGIGGALVMIMEVASTTWGPSGVLGVFVMTAGPQGAFKSAAIYMAALLISYICGYLITDLTFDENELRVHKSKETGSDGFASNPPASGAPYSASLISNDLSPDRLAPDKSSGKLPPDATAPVEPSSDKPAPAGLPADEIPVGRTVHRGELLFFDGDGLSFTYTIKDPAGIHARPAAELVKTVKKSGCNVTVTANGKTAAADSLAQLMDLGAVCGTELLITAEGPDASEGLASMKAFLEENL